MFVRKVTNGARVHLPHDIVEKFNIQQNDMVEITNDEKYILIRKHQPQFICAVTGKVNDDVKQVGNTYISKEGAEMIKNQLMQWEEEG